MNKPKTLPPKTRCVRWMPPTVTPTAATLLPPRLRGKRGARAPGGVGGRYGISSKTRKTSAPEGPRGLQKSLEREGRGPTRSAGALMRRGSTRRRSGGSWRRCALEGSSSVSLAGDSTKGGSTKGVNRYISLSFRVEPRSLIFCVGTFQRSLFFRAQET